jgi:hypothetical protein
MDYKKNIRNILREGITPEYVADEPIANSVVNQMDEAEGEGSNTEEEASDEDYIEIVNKLMKSDIINHSAVMRRMGGIGSWGQADATERSLFEKKLKRKKNDEGGTYRFTKHEAKRIKNILNDPFKTQ